MTQTVPATAALGPGKTGLTIGLRVLNLDGTEYAAFSTTGVAETSVLGTYRKASGVACPDAGGYIVWGVSGTDYAEATVEPVSALSDIQSRIPAALIGGRIDANVGAMAANTLTASALATDAVIEIQSGLATPTNITAGTVTSVTGDVAGKVLGGGAGTITGTGAQVTVAGTLTTFDALWVKIQKWLRLGYRKDAFVVTDHATELAEINANTGSGVGTYTSTTDSLEAVSAGVATIGAIGDPLATVLPGSYPHNSAGDIIYRLRTIDTSNVSVNSPIDGTTITIRRGDTFACSITGLGALTGYKNLWFTIKTNLAHADSSAVIQVDSDTGLLRLYGAAATAVDGEITVDDEAGGDITITLSAAVTSTLAVARNLYYDIQIQDSTDDITTLSSGTCHIVADVTRAIS